MEWQQVVIVAITSLPPCFGLRGKSTNFSIEWLFRADAGTIYLILRVHKQRKDYLFSSEFPLSHCSTHEIANNPLNLSVRVKYSI